MSLSNLPPGVTDRMIDEQCNGPDDYTSEGYCPECGEKLEEDGTCPDCPPENPNEEELEEHAADCTCRHCDPEPVDAEERWIHSHEHEEASYRSAMIDAGRGHLLR